MSDWAPSAIRDLKAIAIVGVGLIGGSIAAAVRRAGFAGRIVGVGRNPSRLDAARDARLIDDAATPGSGLLRTVELAIVCTPVDRIAADVRQIAQAVAPHALLTDAGSVKGPICRALEFAGLEGRTFVGSHPLAGSEKAGFEHARSDLFERRLCVVTPVERSPGAAVEAIESFWRWIGARVLRMTPEAHDTAVAMTSHTPHVVASALAAALPEEFQPLAARGFRDTTRIASGDADLWVAILRENRDAVLQAMDRFAGQLEEFRRALVDSDGLRLKILLEAGKSVRDAISEP